MTATAATLVTFVSTQRTALLGKKPETTSTVQPQATTRVGRLQCRQTAHASPSVRETAVQTWKDKSVSSHGAAPPGHKLD